MYYIGKQKWTRRHFDEAVTLRIDLILEIFFIKDLE